MDMRGRDKQDEELEEFIAARSQDLHHDAYQLTAAQDTAERLVVGVLADMRRERVDLARAGAEARLRMARIAARHGTPTEAGDDSPMRAEFRLLARLSPQQRAVLLLQVVDNLDVRETARALQLNPRAVTGTLHSIPYDELPGTTPYSGELRSFLEDFGDRAIAPSAAATVADVRDAPPPPRRPWWTYVAALLVVALTVATVVVTQGWHNDWLRTPAGLNHAHGTHFPAYRKGYKLVDIRDVEPGPAEGFSVDSASAVTMDCSMLTRGGGMSISSDLTGGSYFRQRGDCSNRAHLAPLVHVSGTALVSINDFSRDRWPVAVYRQVPLREYPVATEDFDVQRNIGIADVRSVQADNGSRLTPLRKGIVLTMHGAAKQPNGTFRGTLHIPAGTSATTLNVVGLLSPTTTGRFRVQVDHRGPLTTCGNTSSAVYGTLPKVTTCTLVDHRIPQIELNLVSVRSEHARTVPVRVSVSDSRGPWTLQLVADRYKPDASAVDDGANS